MTIEQLRIDKELDEISYFDLLKCDEWKAKRLTILKRDDYKCVKCERSKTANLKSGNSNVYLYKNGDEIIPSKESINLQIHHKLYIYNRFPWNYDSEDLETLCNTCHEELHNNEDIVVWDEHKLNKLKFGACDRCSGKGYLKIYKHVDNGICYKCRGYGYNMPLIKLT